MLKLGYNIKTKPTYHWRYKNRSMFWRKSQKKTSTRFNKILEGNKGRIKDGIHAKADWELSAKSWYQGLVGFVNSDWMQIP